MRSKVSEGGVTLPKKWSEVPLRLIFAAKSIA